MVNFGDFVLVFSCLILVVMIVFGGIVGIGVFVGVVNVIWFLRLG